MPIADVYLTSATANLTTLSPTFANVAFRGISGYLETPGGDYRMRVTAAGTKTVLLDVTSVSLAGGSIRTLLPLDKAGGGTPFTSLMLAGKKREA